MARREDKAGWIRAHAASLAFYLYALLLAPPLARALRAGMEAEAPLWGVGILVMAVLLAEPLGLYWKSRFLRRRNRDEGFEPQGSMLAVFSAAGIAHVLVTMILGLLVLDAWGAMGGELDEPPAWGAVVLIGLVLKEFVGLFAAAGQAVSAEPPGHWKETAADVLLWAYGAVAYTAWWQVIVDMEAIGEAPLGQRLALLPVLGALFLFFYLPMRLPFLLDEHHLQPARGRRFRLGAELAAGLVLGLYPVLA